MKSTHFFGLTDMPNEAVPALVDAVFVNGKAPTGISGPTQQGNLFAKTCSERHGMQVSVTVNQRIYRLDAVSEISRCPGSIQVAREEDRELLEAWGLQFSQDCHIDTTIERNRESVTKAIAASSCFLWVVDNEPVAMTELRGPTPSGIRVSNVYTPPQWRGNGYATALVAAVSERALAAGRKFCFLFTDLANPTSNRIYQRIGYRPVCEAVQHIFAKRSD
jgi:predicted GNAT family acetyltransferase